MEGFGSVLRRLRIEKKMTQADLAQRAGISISTIQKVERGDRPRIHWANYRAIAQAIGLSEEELEKMWRGPTMPLTLQLPHEVSEALTQRAEADRSSLSEIAVELLQGALKINIGGDVEQKPQRFAEVRPSAMAAKQSPKSRVRKPRSKVSK